jgi:cytochrome P450
VALDDIDLVDLDRFAGGFPHDVFGRLRAEAPVWWHPPHAKAPGGEGFWVVSRHADVMAVLRDAAVGVASYGRALVAAKRAAPGDDMLSLIVHAEVPDETGRARTQGGQRPPRSEPQASGGRRLADEEIIPFLTRLLVAGAETTRNAIAGGVLALIEHPAEMAALRGDPSLAPRAVEEILRWTSPTAYNRRTATRDVELAGRRIRAGDKVTHWYPSANRDEAVFADPFRFDVRRDPNPQLAFGHGVHRCLGASLARMKIRIVLEEILARDLAFEQAGPVEWARSNKHTGMRHMPVRVAGRRPCAG